MHHHPPSGPVPRRGALHALALAFLTANAGALECTPAWAPSAGLASIGTGYAIAEFDAGDGAGPVLFVGGGIDGSVQQWNGSAWQPLPVGPSAEVRGLAVCGEGAGPSLYATGEFLFCGSTQTPGVARFDGTNWHPVGNGISGFGLCVAEHLGPDGLGVVVGGLFLTASGITVNHIARWDGTTWSALDGGMNGPVDVLLDVREGPLAGLYAGGSFTIAGGSAASRIARWDGRSWSALGTGVNGTVRALAIFDDGSGPALHAAGSITDGSSFVVRKWDGSSWTTVGASFNGTHRALCSHDDGGGLGPSLLVAGDFSIVNSVPPVSAGRLARLGAAGWSSVGPTMNSSGIALRSTTHFGAPSLLVAGAFSAVGAIPSKVVARWAGCLLPMLPADFNGDGAVDGNDLGTLLGGWGPCPGCAEDLDGDGVVGGADLGELLGQWTG